MQEPLKDESLQKISCSVEELTAWPSNPCGSSLEEAFSKRSTSRTRFEVI